METEIYEKKKRKPIGIIATIIIGFIIAAAIPLFVIPSVKYNKANKMLLSGEYDAAREAFLGIEDFKDSKTMVSECMYQKAVYFMDSRKWDEAREIFLSLTGYKDSDVQASECLYKKAESFFNEKDWDRSREIYILLGDYQDSKERANECLYQKAAELRNNKQWDASIAVLEEIEGYGDAKELILENQYDHAKEDIESKNYVDALKRFHDLGYYKDSREYWNGIDVIYDKCVKDDPKNTKIITVCKHDENERLTEVTHSTDSSLQTEYYEYDGEGRCVSHGYSLAVSLFGVISYYTEDFKYDGNGKIETETYDENGTLMNMDYHYSEDRLKEIIYTYSDGSQLIRSYYYDQEGNMIREEAQRKNEEKPYYVLTNEYDEKGNKILMAEENKESGLKTSETYKYDEFGFLSEETKTDTTGLTTKYVFQRNVLGMISSYTTEDSDGYSEEYENLGR